MNGESAVWSHYRRRRTLKAVWELRRRANCARTHLINQTSLYTLCSFNGGDWLQHPLQTTLSSLGCLRRYGREKRRSFKNQLKHIGNLASFLSRLALYTRAQNALKRTPITPFVQTVGIELKRPIIHEIYDWNQAPKIHAEISNRKQKKRSCITEMSVLQRRSKNLSQFSFCLFLREKYYILTSSRCGHFSGFWVHAYDSCDFVFARWKWSIGLYVVEYRTDRIKLGIWSYVTPCSYMKL